jgi:hypothetical protein
MITPAKYEITAYQGATLDKTFTVTTNGTPINWTGYTAAMKVRRYVDSDAVLSLATGSGITALTTDGKVIINATATQTAAIPAGNYVYDLELSSGAYVTKLISGRFVVVAEVTY